MTESENKLVTAAEYAQFHGLDRWETHRAAVHAPIRGYTGHPILLRIPVYRHGDVSAAIERGNA